MPHQTLHAIQRLFHSVNAIAFLHVQRLKTLFGTDARIGLHQVQNTRRIGDIFLYLDTFGNAELVVEPLGALEVLSGDFLLAGFDRAPWPWLLGATCQGLQVRQMPAPRHVYFSSSPDRGLLVSDVSRRPCALVSAALI